MQHALSTMDNEKPPGLNGIPTKALINLVNYGLLLLSKTIQKYWNDNQYNPKVFTQLSLYIAPKTGDLLNPNKW